MRRCLISFACGLFLAACATDQPTSSPSASGVSLPRNALPQQSSPGNMPREMLMDPVTCKGCHPQHYREWEGSMHAYSSDDPVFIAMNKRGQRETNGALGEFCVNCHAPMAVREGLTKDGLNLTEIPRAMKGVTCYFCHNATEVGPDHFNAPIKLANDTVMRGSIRNPVDPKVHGVAYSEYFDNNKMKSSVMCGACHDIVNHKGAHIERTLAEYKSSIMSIDKGGFGIESCQGCHMRWTRSGTTAEMSGMSLPTRDLHEHRWAAVDVALTDDFPHQEEFRRKTECELSSGGVLIFQISTDGRGMFEILIESTAGHQLPSGSAQDRRLWLEFIAYNAAGKVLFQSGVIPDGEVEEYPAGDPKFDRQLTMFRDHFKDESGKEVHMFWEAFKTDSYLLPVPTTPGTRHVATRNYVVPGRQQPARVEMRMRMRPIGVDVLQDLVRSGDLDPEILKRMPTFTLRNTHVEWKPADGNTVQFPKAINDDPSYCD